MALDVSGRKRPNWIYAVIAALALVAGLLAFGWSRFTAPPPDMQVSAPVRINQGVLTGGIDLDNPQIVQFNGIPFASAERWRPPTDPVQWGADVRDARAFGPECMQSREGLGEFVNDIVKGLNLPWWKQILASGYVASQPPAALSEDCLFLNVRTANLDGDEPAPVMVWIHGGSHVSGAGSQGIYQGNNLVEQGAVVVTINYRLGPFGYLAHPALTAADGTSGNYGLLDQIKALEWVRDNIAFFGGDPGNVTVFGESAGAQAVTEIMASPLSEGLFHKAILQSGASSYNAIHLSSSPVPQIKSAESVGADLLADLASDDDADALRAIPAAEVVARMEARPDLIRYWLPNVDGKVIPRMIGDQIGWGGAHRVPILAGYNSDEASLFYPSIQSPTILQSPMSGTLAEREAALAGVFGKNSAKALQALYGKLDEDSWDAGAQDMLGDDMFGVHMRFLGQANAAAGQPTYLYFFTKQPASKGQTLGAYHASELAFVFDTHSPLLPKSLTTDQLTDQIGAYWVNFARTGDPNGDGLPIWPQYHRDTDKWLELGASIQVRENVRVRKLDIIEAELVARIETVRSAMGLTGAIAWEQAPASVPAPGVVAEGTVSGSALATAARLPVTGTPSPSAARAEAQASAQGPAPEPAAPSALEPEPIQASTSPTPPEPAPETAPAPAAAPSGDGLGVAQSFIRPNPALEIIDNAEVPIGAEAPLSPVTSDPADDRSDMPETPDTPFEASPEQIAEETNQPVPANGVQSVLPTTPEPEATQEPETLQATEEAPEPEPDTVQEAAPESAPRSGDEEPLADTL
jgi:para-nitrobenzyl esterase